MKVLTTFNVLLAIFLSASAFALGPIPNGTYKSIDKIKCIAAEQRNNFAYNESIYVGDGNLVNYNEYGVHEKLFVFLKDGQFLVNPLAENGKGYFTEDGLFYEIVINGNLGEDRLRFHDNHLHMTGSVIAGGAMYTCSGIYLKTGSK